MEETVEFKKFVSEIAFESATIRYDSTCDTITIRSHDYGVGLLDALIRLINRYPVKGLVMDGEIGRIRKPKYNEVAFNKRILSIFERHGSSTLENVRFVNLNLKTSFLVAVDQATKNFQQTSLKSIDLSGNRFYEGDASIPLFSILSRCPQLEQLNLGNYNLGVNFGGQEHVFTNFIHTLIHHCPLIRILESNVLRDYYDQFQSFLVYLADYPETLLQFSQSLRQPPDQRILLNYPEEHRSRVSWLWYDENRLSPFIQSTNSIANDVNALIHFIHETDDLMKLIRDTGIVQLKTPYYDYSNLALEAAIHSTTLEEMATITVTSEAKRIEAVCAFIRTCKVKRCGFQLNYLEMEHWVQLSSALCETTGLKEVKLSFNNHCEDFIQTFMEEMWHRTHQQQSHFTLRKINLDRHYDSNHPTRLRLNTIFDMLRVQDVILALIEPRQIDRVGQQSGMRLITVDIIRMLDGYLR